MRYANVADAEQIRRIYAPYVRETAITFEYDVPSVEEFKQRISHTLEHYPYIVAENEKGTIVGYAYASRYYGRAAYDRSVELSIYIENGFQGKGIGRKLYETLEEELRTRGILNLTACIAWSKEPNRYITHQSPRFHKSMGYEVCAHFHKIGYKFGRWFDIIWMEKMLGEHTDQAE
ncbi:MAG: GNAT family N-acetyltransferase [Bacteroidaceae bacterium]